MLSLQLLVVQLVSLFLSTSSRTPAFQALQMDAEYIDTIGIYEYNAELVYHRYRCLEQEH